MADEQHTDESLMLRYQAGDSLAFELLYKRFKTMLYRYLVKQCNHLEQAEELFQEVWLKVIKARKQYERRASFRTYLFHIAHNCIIDHYRRNASAELLSYEDTDSPQASINHTETGPEDIVEGEKLTLKLINLIESLPAAQKEVFLLKHEAGMDLNEIAKTVNVNTETAKSRLRYAMGKLKTGIKEYL